VGVTGAGCEVGAAVVAGCMVGLAGSAFCISPLSEPPPLSHEIKIARSNSKNALLRIIFFIWLIFMVESCTLLQINIQPQFDRPEKNVAYTTVDFVISCDTV
jgi:hypothetical protein